MKTDNNFPFGDRVTTLVTEQINDDQLKQYIRESNRQRLNDKQYTADIINGLMGVCNLLLLRIASLEDFMTRELGAVNLIDLESEDPLAVGTTTKSVSGATIFSRRLKDIECEIAVIKQVVDFNMVTVQHELHLQGNAIIALANFSNTIYIDMVNTQIRLGNLETFTARTELNKLRSGAVDDAIDYISSIGKVIDSMYEWIPIAGQIIKGGVDAVKDFISGSIGIITSSFALSSKLEAMFVMDASFSDSKLIALLAANASGVAPTIPMTNMLSVPVMLNILEGTNTISGIASNNEIPLPAILTYYLRPLNVVEYPVVGPILLDFISKFPELRLPRYTNKLPVHGYITLTWDIPNVGGKYRRQVVMSVGQRSLSLEIALSELTDNLVLWIDRVQKRNEFTNLYEDIRVLNKSEDASVIDMENDASTSTIIETYKVFIDVHYMVQFMKCMKQLETPYNLWNHNCQSMSREIIDFCVNHSLPHWWDALCSVEMLKARFSKQYELPLDLGLGNMPSPYAVNTNYLTDPGPNPNTLDAWRNLYALEIGIWLDILNQAEGPGSEERKRVRQGREVRRSRAVK